MDTHRSAASTADSLTKKLLVHSGMTMSLEQLDEARARTAGVLNSGTDTGLAAVLRAWRRAPTLAQYADAAAKDLLLD